MKTKRRDDALVGGVLALWEDKEFSWDVKLKVVCVAPK